MWPNCQDNFICLNFKVMRLKCWELATDRRTKKVNHRNSFAVKKRKKGQITVWWWGHAAKLLSFQIFDKICHTEFSHDKSYPKKNVKIIKQKTVYTILGFSLSTTFFLWFLPPNRDRQIKTERERERERMKRERERENFNIMPVGNI